ncbi:ATP-binding cassette domain-containing protein [Sphingomonas canadensis]|uniref:ATP-binding cassette domain-containing protein n=1 Tax=Sphingomonas canadensis TaxID=1219257 RepID=A0ABW3H3A9_9SPHN|nr:ATP-binding cassette domain-containing protein [Sphingomonas canadensis]MCW3834743.1 ATP-binding cassette domain-containing protein [Sphingomonas canadensis]
MLLIGNTYWAVACAAGMAAAALARALIQAQAEAAGIAAADAAKRGVRAALFPHLLRSRAQERRMLGEELASAVDQVSALTGYHGRFVPLRRAAAVTPLLIAALVALASPVSAAILVATLIPFAIGMALAGGAARRAADAQVAALSRLSGLFVDRIRALPVILAFGAEDRVTRQLDTAVQGVADRTYAVLRIAFLSSGTLEFFSAISVALVAVYCGFALLGLLPFPVPETLDLPRAFFALALAPEFYLPLRRLAAAYHEKQLGEAAAAAIAERSGAAAPEPAQTAVPPAASLSVEAAVIDYGGGRSVGPFELAVRPGELVALTGATGSGKTSLLHMIIGLAPLASGTLRLGDAPVRPGAVNDAIGWAGQHAALLPGTIARNIALADPAASQDAIAAAAERVGLGPLLAARGDGLDTWIDPRGSGLSGGERRRIALARAVLSGRPLLLLDEPTADLDPATAAAIVALLTGLAREHGVLAATHDPALIAAATRTVAIA